MSCFAFVALLWVSFVAAHVSATLNAKISALKCVDRKGLPIEELTTKDGGLYSCVFVWTAGQGINEGYGKVAVRIDEYSASELSANYARRTFHDFVGSADRTALSIVQGTLNSKLKSAKEVLTVSFKYTSCRGTGEPLRVSVETERDFSAPNYDSASHSAYVEMSQSRSDCSVTLLHESARALEQTSAAADDNTPAFLAIALLVLVCAICLGCIFVDAK
jgi:hypothetical protein